MVLRSYKKENAVSIADWIQTEEELYKWSADRFNKYPLSGDDIDEKYMPQIKEGRFFPVTADDENGNVVENKTLTVVNELPTVRARRPMIGT